jgi:hypothetical protein
VAVETPALFATSLMFMRSLGATGCSRSFDAEIQCCSLAGQQFCHHNTPHSLTETNQLTLRPTEQTICLLFSQ